jgi:AcrR family transcriptional regulator
MQGMGHREDLLAGAKRCLYDKGYAHTTARDIVAASGTNLGSIGYHYGSTQALLQAAMLSAIEDWGDAVGVALAGSSPDGADRITDFWRRMIGTIESHRQLWLASIEAMLQGERSPDLRAQLAAGFEEGRSGMAAIITGRDEATLDPETVRSVGAVQMALMSGVMIQWLIDPAHAPQPEEIAAGLRVLGDLSPRLGEQRAGVAE